MQNKILKKDNYTAFLDHLAHNYKLIAPVLEEENVTFYKSVSSSLEVNLSFANSIVPPKNHFFPASEKILSFSKAGENIKIEQPPESGPAVIFGVRPCDIRSFSLIDPVFNGNFPDSYYSQKRGNILIIGFSCNEVLPTCFCKSFGIKPTEADGADLLFTDLGQHFLVEILTTKGNELIKRADGFLNDENIEQAIDNKHSLQAKLDQEFLRNPDLSGTKQILDSMFDHPYWKELSARCIGCGICTFVCPTCHCFNIIDTSRMDATGARYRCQDSCMFPGFTQMAGGHNPRPTKIERVRNRFMHKLKYHIDRYNMDGCVGCGRCVAKCPVNIDITQIISEIKEVI